MKRFWRNNGLSIVMFTLFLIIGMCLWEWGHGRSGEPYTQLGALAGVAYVLALGALRIRG